MKQLDLFYRGSSMLGTFKPGDKLIIDKIPFKKIKTGDVIVFKKNSDDNREFVVHRVSGITKRGLLTRGDNILSIDNGYRNEEHILGRVIQYDRFGKIRRTQNGHAGIIRSICLHARVQFCYRTKRIFKKPYTMIMKAGCVQKIWHPKISIIRFQTPDGPFLKYLHKKRTVATYWTQKNHFQCKRPYEFYIECELINPSNR